MTFHPLTYDNTFRLDIAKLGERLDEDSKDGTKHPSNIEGVNYKRVVMTEDYHMIIYDLFGQYTLTTYHHSKAFRGSEPELYHNDSKVFYKEGQEIQLRKASSSQGDRYFLKPLNLKFLKNMDAKTVSVSKELAQFFVDYGGVDYYFNPITSKDLPLFNPALTSDKNDNIYTFDLRRLALYLSRLFNLEQNREKHAVATKDLEFKRTITFNEMNVRVSYNIYEFIQNLTTIYTLDVHATEYGEHVYTLSSNERFHHIGMKASDDPIPVELLPVNLEENHCLFQTLDDVDEQSYMSKPLFDLLTSSEDILNLDETKGE